MTTHLERRDFLKAAGLGSLGIMGSAGPVAGLMPPQTAAAIRDLEPMKVIKIEAVKFRKCLMIDGEPPPWMWVRLHTNTGIVGVGETYPATEGEIGTLRDLVAREGGSAGALLGNDPRDIEHIWYEIYDRTAFNVIGGAEMRILSAINIAQW